ncbi:MAG: hypothetical protein NVS3B16_16370 [Vulcanimicrobiaceae bacterium]
MTNRPHSTRLRPAPAPLARAGALLLAFGALAGCTNPNFIGIQDYGTIYGNVVDTAGKPIGGALVSATGTSSTFRSGGDGSFRLPQVSVGTQSVSISAPGYGPPTPPVSVLVVKNVETSVGNVTLPSTTSAPTR